MNRQQNAANLAREIKSLRQELNIERTAHLLAMLNSMEKELSYLQVGTFHI